MSTNAIVGVVVGAIIIVGGGYYVMHKGSAPSTEQSAVQGEAQPQVQAPQEEKFSGSFAELAARTGSWKCMIDTSSGQTAVSGTSYVSGGKVRGDFTASGKGYSGIETHMVGDGTYVYTWSSMMPQGIKTRMMSGTQSATAQAPAAAPSGQGMGANQAYSYNCAPWAADDSVFTVPSDVKFMMVGN